MHLSKSEFRKVFIIFFFCLLCFTSCAGTFFADFALARKDPAKAAKTAAPFLKQITFSDDEIKRITFENFKSMHEEGMKWAEEHEMQKWKLVTPDNLELTGAFFPCEGSHKYVILVHGYTSFKEAMYDYIPYYASWGYNVLAVDNRAHGESQGKWIGMGWLDSNDCLLWINRIVETDPQSVITMLGVSMGGATVMMTSGLDLPSNVKCLVEDCGYSSVWDEFSHEMKVLFHLPDWPFLYSRDTAAQKKAGYSLKEASALKRLENCKVPMLFIHGMEDVFVPFAFLDENVNAYKGPYKEVLAVPGASHGMSLYTAKDEYLNTLKSFLDKFMNV